MFTVLCRHVHSCWQSTEAFLYVTGKSNIVSTWKYIIVLHIKGKNNFKHFLLYTYGRNTYQKGTALMKMYRVVPQTKRGNYHVATVCHMVCKSHSVFPLHTMVSNIVYSFDKIVNGLNYPGSSRIICTKASRLHVSLCECFYIKSLYFFKSSEGGI